MSVPILRPTADTIRIFSPDTGEEIDLLNAPLEDLAAWRAAVLQYEQDARLAKKYVDAEVIRRMDRDASWTVHVDGYTLTAPSPSPGTEYDGEALHEALRGFVKQGVLSQDALAQAVKVETVYRPQHAGINKLLKLGGEVAAVIEACGRPVDRERRVSVKRP